MDNLDNIKVTVIEKNACTVTASSVMVGLPTLVGPVGPVGPQGPAGPSGQGAWGTISGTLSDQTDLQTALDAKADSADLGALAEKDQVAWSTDISGIPFTFPPETHNHDERYYTETEMDTKLAGKQNTLSWDTAPTSGGTNPMTSGAIYVHEPFQVTGTASAGSSVTFTDSRIDSDHWRIPKGGIYFGTGANVTTGVHWVTNPTNHTVTLEATFTGATTVALDMVWFQ